MYSRTTDENSMSEIDVEAFLAWLTFNIYKFIVPLLIGLGGAVIVHFLRHLVDRKLTPILGENKAKLIAVLFAYVGYIGIAIFSLSLIGIDLTAVWLSGTAVALALGFAAQAAFSNVISGLFLYADPSMEVGDAVRVGDVCGVVIDVGFLNTEIRTYDNFVFNIPNQELLNNTILNYSRVIKKRLKNALPLLISLKVSYDSDPAEAEKLLLQLVEAEPIIDPPGPSVFHVGYDDIGIKIELQCFVSIESYEKVNNDLHKAIKETFQAEGIKFAYLEWPYRPQGKP